MKMNPGNQPAPLNLTTRAFKHHCINTRFEKVDGIEGYLGGIYETACGQLLSANEHIHNGTTNRVWPKDCNLFNGPEHVCNQYLRAMDYCPPVNHIQAH